MAAVGAQTKLSDVPTPFALIDARTLRRNILEMQQAMDGIGVSLRPHFKTHRNLAIARWQREAGALGVTVATAAQLTAAKRHLDCPVLVSSPLQVDAAIAPALRTACSEGSVAFSIESPRSIELLRSALGPEPAADVVIEVEAGGMRSGVPASECGTLARRAAKAGLRVAGIFTYPGHAYLPGQAVDASNQELAALEVGASELHRAGFDPEHISAGSTPTMRYAQAGIATEYRPGTYIFGDRQQVGLGAMVRTQLALTVVGTVIAIHGDRLVLDAGGKALGRDAPRWLDGYGQLADESQATISRLYDHHSVVESYSSRPLEVGDRLSIIPNNANSVMAVLGSAWLSEGGEFGEEVRSLSDRSAATLN
jgi:D-serine deaminase-like pyridoxal phosphate-dependent protein